MKKFDVIGCARDHRGTFTKLAIEGILADGTPLSSFVGEFVTVSQPGVLRGLHFQHEPAHAKWIQCLSGRVWDVVVDVRKGLSSYGEWQATELSFEGPLVHVPVGFAHGFCVLGDEPAVLLSRFQIPHAPSGEVAIRFDDPDLKIEWPIARPIVSERDKKAPSFADYTTSSLSDSRWWE